MESRGINHIIDTWIKDLEQMNFSEISSQPSPDRWSLGQVCMHLIESTNFYLEQIKICLSSHNHENEEMTSAAKVMFQNDDFPNEIIEGPTSNADTPQAGSKAELIHLLRSLKAELCELNILISETASKGKTKHPGLHYLNAREWYQFAEMHFRHHLRQKKRIEDHLNNGTRMN